MSAATVMAARGVSLLELMVVLLILGVLIGVTLPGYRRHLLAAHRAEASQALQALHLAQERFRSQQARYAASVKELGLAERSAGGRYRLSVIQSSADSYSLEAEALGEQAKDSLCRRLKLVQAAGQLSFQGYGLGNTPSSGCWPQ